MITKKVNKSLNEILGAESNKLMALPNQEAHKFFDKQEDKDRIADVLSGAFKVRPGKDYYKKLYGYN